MRKGTRVSRERDIGLQRKTKQKFGYSEREQSYRGGALTRAVAHTLERLVCEVELDVRWPAGAPVRWYEGTLDRVCVLGHSSGCQMLWKCGCAMWYSRGFVMRLRSGKKRALQKLLPNIRLRDMVKKRGCEFNAKTVITATMCRRILIVSPPSFLHTMQHAIR